MLLFGEETFDDDQRDLLLDIVEQNIKSGRIKNQVNLNSKEIFQLYFKSTSVSRNRECLVLALIPINPSYWAAFSVSTIVVSKGDLAMSLKIVFIMKQYLESSQSDLQWRSRFWEIIKDTLIINSACEIFEVDYGGWYICISNRLKIPQSDQPYSGNVKRRGDFKS